MRFFILIFILVSSLAAQAEESVKEPKAWEHESEASIVQVEGNTSSENYSGKQKTSYTFSDNVITAAARYLQSKSGGTETARQWDASLRYEREFSKTWAAFLQHGAESDPYAGYLQRDNSDIGAKYYFMKSEPETLFAELGYRHSQTLSSPEHEVGVSNSGRLYVEYEKQINHSVTGKLWAEYLPNFTKSEAYLINYEPSINVMMSEILSMKVSYLVKYHNLTVDPDEKKQDTTFTTALVAKY